MGAAMPMPDVTPAPNATTPPPPQAAPPPTAAPVSMFSMGQNLLGEVGQNQRSAMDINSRRRDSLDRFSQVMSSMPNVSCCFIFLAAHGGELPWWVRYLRNVLADDETRRGYIRMSRWLVPILQRSEFARVITQAAMTYPITEYGAAMVGVRPEGIVFAPIKRFWFAVWKHLGK